jgi:hypothetical protein
MPLFDIECRKCNRVHEVVMEWQEEAVVFNCSGCTNQYHDLLPPLTAMQPDNMWHNGQTGLGNFNSKKQYKDYIKNNNLERATRENYESAQKKQSKRFETVAQKNKENLTKFIEKELSGVEVSPDGNTVKEKNKFTKARE